MRASVPMTAALLAACAASDPIVTPPTAAEPATTPGHPPEPATSAAPAIRPAPLVDLGALSGYVSSREASQGTPPRFAARVADVDTATAGVWRVVLAADPGTYEIKIQAPAALPSPLRSGEDVRVTVQGGGGGPNYYLHLIFTTPDGQLLFALGMAPDDWRVTRGERGDTDRGDDYTERYYGVNFEHASVRASVPAGGWARMAVGGVTYYVWGSAVRRKLRPGRRPMPDYVGAWLDYAVVRAR